MTTKTGSFLKQPEMSFLFADGRVHTDVEVGALIRTIGAWLHALSMHWSVSAGAQRWHIQMFSEPKKAKAPGVVSWPCWRGFSEKKKKTAMTQLMGENTHWEPAARLQQDRLRGHDGLRESIAEQTFPRKREARSGLPQLVQCHLFQNKPCRNRRRSYPSPS